MATEGYMFCSKLKTYTGSSFEIGITRLIKILEKNHPEFKFNTCLVSNFDISDEVLNIDGITIVPYPIPKGHFWFILQEGKSES